MPKDHDFCDDCPLCRPCMMQQVSPGVFEPLPADHPQMVVINKLWDEDTTFDERKACIAVWVDNSRDPDDLQLAGGVAQRIAAATEDIPLTANKPEAMTDEEISLRLAEQVRAAGGNTTTLAVILFYAAVEADLPIPPEVERLVKYEAHGAMNWILLNKTPDKNSVYRRHSRTIPHITAEISTPEVTRYAYDNLRRIRRTLDADTRNEWFRKQAFRRWLKKVKRKGRLVAIHWKDAE